MREPSRLCPDLKWGKVLIKLPVTHSRFLRGAACDVQRGALLAGCRGRETLFSSSALMDYSAGFSIGEPGTKSKMFIHLGLFSKDHQQLITI